MSDNGDEIPGGGYGNPRAQPVLQAINRLYARVYHQVEVRSPQRLPARGPAILVCNHTSGIDPELIQSCCPRIIIWMMAREYYEVPGLRKVLDWIGVIPVSRGARDSAATRAAMRALSDGKILGLFPEGKIETTSEILPFQAGVGVMAMKSEAPVYPAYLDGTQRGSEMKEAFARRQRATLAFGPPLRFSRNREVNGGIENVTKQIQNAVAALRPSNRKV